MKVTCLSLPDRLEHPRNRHHRHYFDSAVFLKEPPCCKSRTNRYLGKRRLHTISGHLSKNSCPHLLIYGDLPTIYFLRFSGVNYWLFLWSASFQPRCALIMQVSFCFFHILFLCSTKCLHPKWKAADRVSLGTLRVMCFIVRVWVGAYIWCRNGFLQVFNVIIFVLI